MIVDDYSTNPHIVYLWALEQAGKGQDVYVAEVIYPHPSSPIYYRAFKGERPKPEPTMSSLIVEMGIPGFDMYGWLDDRSVRIIHKVMMRIDDSNLWPISGRFNATNRAINRLRYNRHEGAYDCPYSYWKSLEAEISAIVNGDV
jgi:hypothetical protein